MKNSCKDCVFWNKSREECIAKNKDQECPYERFDDILQKQKERLKKEGN
jgi:hypothetical protein